MPVAAGRKPTIAAQRKWASDLQKQAQVERFGSANDPECMDKLAETLQQKENADK